MVAMALLGMLLELAGFSWQAPPCRPGPGLSSHTGASVDIFWPNQIPNAHTLHGGGFRLLEESAPWRELLIQ